MGNFVWSKNEIRIFIGWLNKVKILPQPVAEFNILDFVGAEAINHNKGIT